jgi:hypothetical protein
VPIEIPMRRLDYGTGMPAFTDGIFRVVESP